jgi:hypothetical protein
MFVGDFTTTTLRNARGVTDADVQNYAICRVGGVLYRAVTEGTTSASWLRLPSSGAWTGAAVAGTNVATIGAVVGTYHIIGDVVSLSGAVASVVPIASNFAATTDAHGIAMGSVFTAGVVTGSTANNRLVVTGSFSANTTISIYVNASYTLL